MTWPLREELDALLDSLVEEDLNDNGRSREAAKIRAIASKAKRQGDMIVLRMAYSAIGELYGRTGQGLRWHRKASRCFPENATYHLVVANCLLAMKRKRDALVYIANAHKLGLLPEQQLRECESLWGKK